jgi:uncharacterized protein (TIGR02246 family)
VIGSVTRSVKRVEGCQLNSDDAVEALGDQRGRRGAKESVQPMVDALNAAWNRADATAFSTHCTEDVDFTNPLGLRISGRAGVTRLHETIFKGPVADSTLTCSIENVRVVSDDAIVPDEVEIPKGPVKGHLSTIATILFIREDAGWQIASFNEDETRVDGAASQPRDARNDFRSANQRSRPTRGLRRSRKRDGSTKSNPLARNQLSVDG